MLIPGTPSVVDKTYNIIRDSFLVSHLGFEKFKFQMRGTISLSTRGKNTEIVLTINGTRVKEFVKRAFGRSTKVYIIH